jgi:hypothetical protein
MSDDTQTTAAVAIVTARLGAMTGQTSHRDSLEAILEVLRDSQDILTLLSALGSVGASLVQVLAVATNQTSDAVMQMVATNLSSIIMSTEEEGPDAAL